METFDEIISYLRDNLDKENLNDEDKTKFTELTNKILTNDQIFNLDFDEIGRILEKCSNNGLDSKNIKEFLQKAIDKTNLKKAFPLLFSLKIENCGYKEASFILSPFNDVPIIKELTNEHNLNDIISDLEKKNEELNDKIKIYETQKEAEKEDKRSSSLVLNQTSPPKKDSTIVLTTQNKCKILTEQASKIIALEKEISVLRTLPPLIEQSQKENAELKKMLFNSTKLTEGDETAAAREIATYSSKSPRDLTRSLQPYVSARDLAEFDAQFQKRKDKGESIHVAAYHNDIAAMALLLKEKPDSVNHKTKYEGYTPLHIASGKGYDEMCQLLINGGKADINCRTLHQSTPLMRAILNEKTSTALLLIQKGADLSLENDHNENALLLASKKKNKKVIEELINKGCNIYEENKNGDSPVSVCNDKRLKQWMISFYSSKALV